MTEMTTEITAAAERCRAAWAAAPDAKFAWCCHHQVEFEALREPAENRIAYILSAKPKHEQVHRLDNFRPVLSPLPESIIKAYAEWDKDYAERDKAYAELDKARAEWYKACAEWGKDRAERGKARAERDKAYAEWDKACAERGKDRAERGKACAEWNKSEAHLADVPNHTWNGKDIF